MVGEEIHFGICIHFNFNMPCMLVLDVGVLSRLEIFITS